MRQYVIICPKESFRCRQMAAFEGLLFLLKKIEWVAAIRIFLGVLLRLAWIVSIDFGVTAELLCSRIEVQLTP
jgi:hypothetical protein